MRRHHALLATVVLTATLGTAVAVSGAEEAADASDTSTGRIVNLYDAFGPERAGVTKDFGFSAFVEYRGKRILFDAGTDADILRQNAAALGVDLATVDFAVASHSHADHISGFDYLLEVNPDVRIYFPDDFFGGAAPVALGIKGTDPDAADALPEDMRYFGGGVDTAQIRSSGRYWKADVVYVKETTTLEPGITLVATRSPYLGNFIRYPNLTVTGEPAESEVQFIGLPELSLALDAGDDTVLIVGCSHSGVESIVKATAETTGRDISLVMGGYHLLPYKEDTLRGVAARLKDELGVDRVAPAHCTGHLAFKVLMDAYGPDFIRAGLGSETRF